MPIDWAPFVELVRRHQRFLLTTHIRPDGDGLGSILALGEVLRQEGKQVRLVNSSAMPARYAFLDPDGRVEHFSPPGEEYRDAEVVLVMDTGTWNQLGAFGPFLKSSSAAKVVIDHHMTQDDLGAVRLVDTSAEATGRLAYEAIQALGGPLPASAASMLYVAVAMDTGWFRHSNTSPATHTLAAKLLEAGARADLLWQELYERDTLPRKKLIGRVHDRLQVVHGGRIAYTELRLADYAETGASPADTEDLIDCTRSVTGVEVGLFFMEQPRGGVKVSFRSRGVDVARVAERFGGGGHKLASGCVIEASLEEARARVLEAVGAALTNKE